LLPTVCAARIWSTTQLGAHAPEALRSRFVMGQQR
jgi:hypothetical protein